MTIARPVRLAVVLWVVWAIVVWNVIFDRVLVLAGRRYVYAAWLAAEGQGPYLRAGDWMRAATTRGLWTATSVAGALLVVGLVLIAIASRRIATSSSSEPRVEQGGMPRAQTLQDGARDSTSRTLRLDRA